MAIYNFQLSTIVKSLENDARLVEGMLFPKVSCYGDDLCR
jgi:hypothetical protein